MASCASLLAVVSVRCLQYVTSQAALVRPRMGTSSLKVLPKASGTPWGHHRFWPEDPVDQFAERALGRILDSPRGSRRPRRENDPPAQDRGKHLSCLQHVTTEQRSPILEAQQEFWLEGMQVGRAQASHPFEVLEFRLQVGAAPLKRLHLGDEGGQVAAQHHRLGQPVKFRGHGRELLAHRLGAGRRRVRGRRELGHRLPDGLLAWKRGDRIR